MNQIILNICLPSNEYSETIINNLSKKDIKIKLDSLVPSEWGYFMTFNINTDNTENNKYIEEQLDNIRLKEPKMRYDMTIYYENKKLSSSIIINKNGTKNISTIQPL